MIHQHYFFVTKFLFLQSIKFIHTLISFFLWVGHLGRFQLLCLGRFSTEIALASPSHCLLLGPYFGLLFLSCSSPIVTLSDVIVLFLGKIVS